MAVVPVVDFQPLACSAQPATIAIEQQAQWANDEPPAWAGQVAPVGKLSVRRDEAAHVVTPAMILDTMASNSLRAVR